MSENSQRSQDRGSFDHFAADEKPWGCHRHPDHSKPRKEVFVCSIAKTNQRNLFTTLLNLLPRHQLFFVPPDSIWSVVWHCRNQTFAFFPVQHETDSFQGTCDYHMCMQKNPESDDVNQPMGNKQVPIRYTFRTHSDNETPLAELMKKTTKIAGVGQILTDCGENGHLIAETSRFILCYPVANVRRGQERPSSGLLCTALATITCWPCFIHSFWEETVCFFLHAKMGHTSIKISSVFQRPVAIFSLKSIENEILGCSFVVGTAGRRLPVSNDTRKMRKMSSRMID